MKTKTGKLLLQKRAKNIENNNIQQISGENKSQAYRPQFILEEKSRRQNFQGKTKNLIRIEQQSEFNIINQENKTVQQIRIKNSKGLNFYQAHSINLLSHQKLHVESASKQIQTEFWMEDSEKLKEFKQSVQKLQTQNYRLIEQNYILILYYKRLLKENKQNFMNIANFMQNLEYNQLIKLVYDSLAQNKQKQQLLSHFNTSNTGDKRNLEKEFHRSYHEERKKKLKISNQILNQFYLSQHFCKDTQISTKKDHDNNQYLEEFMRQSKNRHSMLEKINPFEPAPFNEYRSENSIQKIYSFKSNGIFLNRQKKNSISSDCPESFQFSNFDHIPDQNSLNSNNKLQTNNLASQKFYGNRNELYKMLLLQASAIEHFCFNQNY